MVRRHRRIIAVLAAMSLAVAACGDDAATTTTAAPGTTGAGDTSAPEASGELVVGVWGGVWETALNELIVDFEDQTGVEVVLDISSSTDRVAKLQAGAGGSTMDVAFLTPEAMAVANQNGLVATISEDSVPNLAVTAVPLLENFAAEGGGYFAVPVSWTAQGILWREDLVPFEIENFTDLWRPELEGRIAIQNMPTLGAASTLIQAAHAYGGSQDDLEPGWEALAELRPNIQQFFSVSSDALAALVNGDLWAVVTIAGQGVALADEGVRITIPAEGASYSIQAVAVTASAANPDAAEQFINFLMSPEVQARWVELTLAAPGGIDVPVASEIDAQLAESPELLPNLIDVDFLDMGLKMQEWTERWQREIAG